MSIGNYNYLYKLASVTIVNTSVKSRKAAKED